MRFALMLESQQGLSYGDHVAIAKRAEANGIETLFRSDHYTSFPGPGGQPTTDAWTVMAGLARETDRIGLGVLVSPVTFRHPGSFAKVVTTVDEMSGGRIEVGVGAGWNEHRAPPARAAVPADQGARRPDGGPAGDPPRSVGRAGRLVVRGPPGHDPRTRRSTPSRSTCPAGRGRRSAAPGRGCWSVGRARRARTGSPRATRTSSTCRSSGPDKARQAFAAVDAACEAIGRDPATRRPLDDGRGPDRARRGRDGRPARRGGQGVRVRATTTAPGSRSASSAGSPARPTRRASRSAGSPRRASSGSCSRTSCRGTST